MSSLKPVAMIVASAMAAAFATSVSMQAVSAEVPAATTAASAATPTQTIVVPGSTGDVLPGKQPGTYRAAPGAVEPQDVMTTGVTRGSTRINVGDHASPKLPVAPAAVPAPMAVAPQPAAVIPPGPTAQIVLPEPPAAGPAKVEAAPVAAPMPKPKRDHN